MENIKLNDSGAAVEDVQSRLAKVGCLEESQVTGVFGTETADAVKRFCTRMQLAEKDYVDEKIWNALVDESFTMGDRTLYLRMPHFHGRDVSDLQQALGALGFTCGAIDGIFGAHTELALRKFQTNLGLPNEGICGAYTFAALNRLHHSWEGKEVLNSAVYLGFARAADVLERHELCLFGIDDFSRSVASRMSNLSLATNPSSKVLSAESLPVAPDESMLLVQMVLPQGAVAAQPQGNQAPRVVYEDDRDVVLARRMETAIRMARLTRPCRITVELPGTMWMDAGEGRSAQHFAITLLDALCSALAAIEEDERDA